MSTRLFHILTALCGFLSAVTLITSFIINQGPPPGSTVAQVIVWGRQNVDSILLGAWLQGIGAILAVIFVLAIVRLAGAMTWLSGWLTLLAGTLILAVGLAEITFYISAVYGGLNNDVTTVSISLTLIKAVQHVYLIAPTLLLPLGVVVLGSRVLPPVFGYLAFVFGAVLEILGLVGLFAAIQTVVDFVPSLFEIWVVAAAITLVIRTGRASNSGSLHERTPVVSHSQ